MTARYLLIIGAAKSGTTTLFNWLGAHPGCFLSKPKEPKHFTDFGERRWSGPGIEGFLKTLKTEPESYEALFRAAPPEAWRVEASTDYLWCPASPESIRRHADRHPTRLICILRDPVARMFSEYAHTVRDRWETGSFAESLRREPERIAAGWQPLFHHVGRSRYAGQVARYRALFGPDEFLVLGHEELRDRAALMRRINRFLGFPEETATAIEAPGALNASYGRRSALVDRATRSPALRRAARMLLPGRLRHAAWEAVSELNKTRLKMTSEERELARRAIGEEIEACRETLGINTSGWGLPAKDGAGGARSHTAANGLT